MIWTSYFFSHFGSTRAQRSAFRAALVQAGFAEVGMDTEGTDNRFWHHWSHTLRRAERNALREADRLAAQIATDHGVRYDEWQVARDPQTGRLRPAES